MQPHRSSFSSRTLATLALLAALLALPMPALAGTPDDPEIVDDALDAGAGNAYADILAGWIEQPTPDIARLTLRVALLPEATFGTAYGIVFDANGRTYVAGLAAIPEPTFVLVLYDRDTNRASGMQTISGSYTIGPDATIVTDVPLALLPENTTALTGLAAIALDIKGDFVNSGVILELDTAKGSRDFALANEPGAAAGPTGDAKAADTAAGAAAGEDAVAPAAEPGDVDVDAPREVPAPGLVALLAAVGAGTLARCRRRRRC